MELVEVISLFQRQQLLVVDDFEPFDHILEHLRVLGTVLAEETKHYKHGEKSWTRTEETKKVEDTIEDLGYVKEMLEIRGD